MGMVILRFDIFLITLDPTVGSEIQKTRPCLIISPNELNRHLNTVIVAPFTSTMKQYPTRIPVNFEGKDGFIVLDQIRTVSKQRLIKKLGVIEVSEQIAVLGALGELFAES
jgi:mRNA interferase MazF